MPSCKTSPVTEEEYMNAKIVEDIRENNTHGPRTPREGLTDNQRSYSACRLRVVAKMSYLVLVKKPRY